MRRGTLIAILILVLVLATAAIFQAFLFVEGDERYPGGETPTPTSSP